MNFLQLPIIAYHRSPLSEKFGIPRQPNLVDVPSTIEFVSPFGTPAAFVGIERYSHLWVMWQFHHNREQANFRPQVRPPRLGGNAKMGVFATRSMYRPSQLGLSVVRLAGVQVVDGLARLHIIGADMADGTPIVDVKPYLPFADSIQTASSEQIDTPVIKPVFMTQAAQALFEQFCQMGRLDWADIKIIKSLIAQDPRPAYRQMHCNESFVMRYKQVDIAFMMIDDGVLMIDDVRDISSLMP